MHSDSQKLRRSCLALHLLAAGDLRRWKGDGKTNEGERKERGYEF